MGNLSTDETWAVTEFADAELGDLRRTQRLVELATVLAQRPSASLPEACGGDRAFLKATYRFFDNTAIAPPELLQSHSDATLLRLSAVPHILAVQDTTEVDWTAHPTTTGLGPLTHPAHRGLHVHTTLAFTPERVPLGLLAQQVWARDPTTVGQKATRKQRAIADKESHKWLVSLQAVCAARAACPQTRFVRIGDREADVYDLFLVARPPGVELLVRAAWDRRVAHPEGYLWATLATRPAAATRTVQVPRRGEQPPRTATLTVRFGPVTLRPPRHRARERLPVVPIWAVQVLEEQPPAGAEPVEWLLLTTAVVPDVATATTCVDWYGGRWGIETNLRHLKQTMGLDVLHCQRLVGVLKELTVFALVYNLVRVVMLAAAQRQGVALERISFVDAVRWLSTARPGDPLPPLVVNPHRPDRVEPRAVKRRPKPYPLLMQPRRETRNALKQQHVGA
jgi:hypothetical protein